MTPLCISVLNPQRHKLFIDYSIHQGQSRLYERPTRTEGKKPTISNTDFQNIT